MADHKTEIACRWVGPVQSTPRSVPGVPPPVGRSLLVYSVVSCCARYRVS